MHLPRAAAVDEADVAWGTAVERRVRHVDIPPVICGKEWQRAGNRSSLRARTCGSEGRKAAREDEHRHQSYARSLTHLPQRSKPQTTARPLTFGDDMPRTHGSADAFVERISNPFKTWSPAC